MNVQVQDVGATERSLPFECVALVLQGGGALGAYQAGVYEAWLRLASIPIGSPVCQSGRSTGPSLLAILRIPGSGGCVSFGRR
jgi:hypothetical protein